MFFLSGGWVRVLFDDLLGITETIYGTSEVVPSVVQDVTNHIVKYLKFAATHNLFTNSSCEVPAWGSQWLPTVLLFNLNFNAQNNCAFVAIKLINSRADPACIHIKDRSIATRHSWFNLRGSILSDFLSHLLPVCQNVWFHHICQQGLWHHRKYNIGLAAHSWAFWEDQYSPACHNVSGRLFFTSCSWFYIYHLSLPVGLTKWLWSPFLWYLSLYHETKTVTHGVHEFSVIASADEPRLALIMNLTFIPPKSALLLWWLGLVSGFNVAQGMSGNQRIALISPWSHLQSTFHLVFGNQVSHAVAMHSPKDVWTVPGAHNNQVFEASLGAVHNMGVCDLYIFLAVSHLMAHAKFTGPTLTRSMLLSHWTGNILYKIYSAEILKSVSSHIAHMQTGVWIELLNHFSPSLFRLSPLLPDSMSENSMDLRSEAALPFCGEDSDRAEGKQDQSRHSVFFSCSCCRSLTIFSGGYESMLWIHIYLLPLTVLSENNETENFCCVCKYNKQQPYKDSFKAIQRHIWECIWLLWNSVHGL